jgi:hypothetical protein
MAKEVKSESELKALLMAEIRKCPECNHIDSVYITKSLPNSWDVAWVLSGPKTAGARAQEMVNDFRLKFDLG